MLALDHPEIAEHLRKFPGGLAPIHPEGRLSLAMKLSKESLLAIKQNGGFSVYVVPFRALDAMSFGFLSAFFDDEDQPLVACTPLFGDDVNCIALVGLMLAPEIDIYFFDDLGREWMSYTCSVEDPGSHLATEENLQLPPYDHDFAGDITDGLKQWFGLRTPADDARAIKVRLGEPLSPDDIAILDAREGAHDYLGSDGYGISTLERDATQPGYFQERDIAEGLRRILSADQIILNPKIRDSNDEFADVVAGTDSAILLIQAKDSPNTPESLARTVARKQAVSEKQVKKALTQVKGMLRYAAEGDPIPLTLKEVDFELHVAGRELVSLAIVREIFPAQTPAITATVRESRGRGQKLVVLDYMGFSAFIHYAQAEGEERLIEDLEAYGAALEAGIWIDPRGFLVDRFLKSPAAAALRDTQST